LKDTNFFEFSESPHVVTGAADAEKKGMKGQIWLRAIVHPFIQTWFSLIKGKRGELAGSMALSGTVQSAQYHPEPLARRVDLQH
jgi:hypothetical protein